MSVKITSSKLLFLPRNLIVYQFCNVLLFALISPFQYNLNGLESFAATVCDTPLSYNLNSEPFLKYSSPSLLFTASSPANERVEPAYGEFPDVNNPEIKVALRFNCTCLLKLKDSPVVFTNVD